MNWEDFNCFITALCAWREARGEGGIDATAKRDALRGVIHVIANRAKARNKSWAEIVFQRLQFSSMTAPGDPQLYLVPVSPDYIFASCFEIATNVYNGGDFDLTQGATHYYADYIAPPSWITGMVKTTQIGHHIYFKEN